MQELRLSKLRSCFRSKEDSKIAKSKIAIKIERLYSTHFVESNRNSKIAKSKFDDKIEGFNSNNIKLNIYIYIIKCIN